MKPYFFPKPDCPCDLLLTWIILSSPHYLLFFSCCLFFHTPMPVLFHFQITSAAKHAESNGAARGLSTLAQARNAITQAKKTGRETNYWPLMTVRRLVCTDTNAYAIDLLGGSSTISNGSSASSSSDSNSPSTSEFSGDVSDVSTPCGVLLQSEVNEAILRLRAWHDRSQNKCTGTIGLRVLFTPLKSALPSEI